MAAPEPENVPTVKAYKNLDFLGSAVARPIRIFCELQEPAKRLEEHGVENYIVFSGSHAVASPEEVAAWQEVAKGAGQEAQDARQKLERAERTKPLQRYHEEVREFAKLISEWSKARRAEGKPGYLVATGGGPGLMEAANRGAQEGGQLTVGFGSTRPEWVSLNKNVSKELAFEFHYFFMRKFWMAYKCMAVVVAPGGYGTLDELFEFLNLTETKKISHRLPIILLGKDHWKKAVNWDYLVETGLLLQEHLEKIAFVDTAREGMDYLQEQFKLMESVDGFVPSPKKRKLLTRTSTLGSST